MYIYSETLLYPLKGLPPLKDVTIRTYAEHFKLNRSQLEALLASREQLNMFHESPLIPLILNRPFDATQEAFALAIGQELTDAFVDLSHEKRAKKRRPAMLSYCTLDMRNLPETLTSEHLDQVTQLFCVYLYLRVANYMISRRDRNSDKFSVSFAKNHPRWLQHLILDYAEMVSRVQNRTEWSLRALRMNTLTMAFSSS